MAFTIKRNSKGEVCKASAKFGKMKEICFMLFNDMHLGDSKNCFVNGKSDFQKMKSISFNKDEVLELRRLLPEFEKYDALFRAEQVSFFS